MKTNGEKPGCQVIAGYDPCKDAGNAWFDEQLADRAARFFPTFLKHIEGSTAGNKFELQPWQDNFIRMLFGWQVKDTMGRNVRRYREVFLMIPRKNGKALALDTPIPTPGGWVNMGDIKRGDLVFNENGEPCRVLEAHDVMHGHDCYEVAFSDGSKITADAGHLWAIYRFTLSARASDCFANRWLSHNEIITTQDIFDAIKNKPLDFFMVECLDKNKLCNYVFISGVKKVNSVPVRCIRVDNPRSLFLAGRGMVATHNTPLAAGIALYTFFCDQEIGAQIFCAAADTEQAALLFRHARGMVESEPELDSRADIFKGTGHRSIVLKKDPGSFFKVLSSDAKTKHGGNTHMVMIDELHAQKDRELVDVLETSMASATRKQPLMINITTADFERISICNEKHDYARKVRDGIIKDRAFLPVLYETLLTEDWKDPTIWAKCNPNLGVSVSLDYMRAKCLKAQESPVYENTFKRLHLNIRTTSNVALIDMDDWDKCTGDKYELSELEDEVCFAGLDLASTTDLAALALYFPRIKYAIWFFWCPADNIEKRQRRDRVPYKMWAEQKLIEPTQGNVIDYTFIIQKIIELRGQFSKLQAIAYDPWNARQTALHLQDQEGFNMVEFGQWFSSMNEPTKELLRLVKSHQFNHGGNPMLRWMASNATAHTDSAERIKISKKGSKEKIDGLIAAVMALGLAMTNKPEEGTGLNGKTSANII